MAAETRYNVALLEKVRDTIADEGQHDQTLWAKISRATLALIPDRWTDRYGNQYVEVSCPTAACVAGWAASLSGAKMIVDTGHLQWDRAGTAEITAVVVDGQELAISTYAREQLGLTPAEADALFAGEWTNEQVLENLDEIIFAARHGQEWSIKYVDDYTSDDDDYDGEDY